MEHVNQIISKREKENIMKEFQYTITDPEGIKEIICSDVITYHGISNGHHKFCGCTRY